MIGDFDIPPPVDNRRASGNENMSKLENPFAHMPRCGAKKRDGTPCRRIGSKRNGRCRLHGGRAGAPSGERNGRWRHGGETKAAIAQRRMIRALLRDAMRLTRST
jgi:hypothetical protein